MKQNDNQQMNDKNQIKVENRFNDENLIERCVDSQLIFDGRVVRLFRDRVSLPNGDLSTREYVRHVGAVAVLPLTDEGDVICVRQYRYAHGQIMLEIPAGKLDSPDEDPASAALRELSEETGAKCTRLTHLCRFFSTPAICNEKIDLYLAEGLSYGDAHLDDDEFLSTLRIPLSELTERVMRGEIPDGKTQTAVLMVAELLHRRTTESNH